MGWICENWSFAQDRVVFGRISREQNKKIRARLLAMFKLAPPPPPPFRSFCNTERGREERKGKCLFSVYSVLGHNGRGKGVAPISSSFKHRGLSFLDPMPPRVRTCLCPFSRMFDPQSTHRVVIANFLRTSHYDGKISPGWWGCTPTPLSAYWYHHIQSCRYTPSISSLYPGLYVLYGFTPEIFFRVTNILIVFRKKSLNVSWKQKAAEEADLVLSDDADSDVDQVSNTGHCQF